MAEEAQEKATVRIGPFRLESEAVASQLLFHFLCVELSGYLRMDGLTRSERDGQVQGRLQWRQTGADFELRLSGPFGLNPVHVNGNLQTGEATLHDGEENIQGQIEEVMRERLGFALPLAELVDLVRGIPVSDAGEVMLDGQARALRILQGGWEINYRDYSCCEEPTLPGRVRFAQEAMRGVLVVREWSRN